MEISEAREGRAVAIQALSLKDNSFIISTGQIRSVDRKTRTCVFRTRDGKEFPMRVSSLRSWVLPQDADIGDVVYVDCADTFGVVTDIESRQLDGEPGHELVVRVREKRSALLFVPEENWELV